MLKQWGRMLTWCALLSFSACAATPKNLSVTVVPEIQLVAAPDNKVKPAPEEEVHDRLERLQAACDSWRATGVYHDGLEGDRLVNGIMGILFAGGAVAVSLRGMLLPKKDRPLYAASALMLLLVAQAAVIAASPPSPQDVEQQCELFPPLPLP